MREKVLVFISMILFLTGCGGEDSSGVTQIALTPTAVTIAVPTRPPLSEEEINHVIEVNNQVNSVIGTAIPFNNPISLQNIIKELQNIYGIEDVYTGKDTLAVLYENGGVSCFTDDFNLSSESLPELPDIEKPDDNSEKELYGEGSIESNKVILINAFSGNSLRTIDITALNSIEGWFQNYLKYSVTRLNGTYVTINSFKNLEGYGTIIYNGDGNFLKFTRKDGTKEYITAIQSNQKVSSLNKDGYWDDWYNYRVISVNNNLYYITDKFFDYYYYGKKFSNTLFYNGASRGTRTADNQLPMGNSLYNKGVGAYIGWSDIQSISMSSAYLLFYSMIYNGVTLSDGITSLTSQYTQQKTSYGTAYLGYYPSQGGDISLFVDTGHSFDSATSVTAPYNSMSLIKAGNSNYYKVEINNPSIITAKITFNNKKSNLDLYLYDSAKNEINSSKGTGNEEIIVSTVQTGIFYIAVNGSGSNSYNITIDTVVTGHTFDSGTDITIPYSAYHEIGSSGTDNYYKINLSEKSGIRIQINVKSGSDINLYLYDEARNEIGRTEGTGEAKSIENLLTGIYYIAVKGSQGKYNITVAKSGGVGHTFETATEITLPYTADHFIEGYEIDNFYKIKLQEEGSIDSTISFTSSNGDLDLYLFDSSRKLITKSESLSNEETVSAKTISDKGLTSSLKSGIYYIKVHGYFGSLNSYTITVSKKPPASLSSVTDNDGDNKDDNNSYSVVSFTLKGENFRKNKSSAKGRVTFVRVDDLSEGEADITSWSEEEIKGTVVLPGGKYWVHVTVKGYVTQDEVFYFKGLGDVGF